MKPKNPPILQYVCLAVLFAVAAGYQVRAVLSSFPAYFHRQAAANPLIPDYQKGHPVAQFVGLSAQRAGVKDGDILLAVNGRPFRGLAVFGEAMRRAKPGDSLTVEVLTPGDTAPRSATIRLEPLPSPPFNWTGASILALKLVMPTFSSYWVSGSPQCGRGIPRPGFFAALGTVRGTFPRGKSPSLSKKSAVLERSA